MRQQKQSHDLLYMLGFASLALNLVTVAFLVVFEMRIQEFKSRVDEGIGRMRQSASGRVLPPPPRD